MLLFKVVLSLKLSNTMVTVGFVTGHVLSLMYTYKTSLLYLLIMKISDEGKLRGGKKKDDSSRKNIIDRQSSVNKVLEIKYYKRSLTIEERKDNQV